MKKFIATFCVFASLSCGKKGVDPLNPTGNCFAYTQTYSNVLSTYLASPSKQSCEALLKSIDELVSKCSLYLTAEEKREYSQSRSDVDCNQFNM